MDATNIANGLAIIVFGYGAFLYGKKKCGGLASAICLALVSPIVLMMGFLGGSTIVVMPLSILYSVSGLGEPSEFVMTWAIYGMLMLLSVAFTTYAVRLEPDDKDTNPSKDENGA